MPSIPQRTTSHPFPQRLFRLRHRSSRLPLQECSRALRLFCQLRRRLGIGCSRRRLLRCLSVRLCTIHRRQAWKLRAWDLRRRVRYCEMAVARAQLRGQLPLERMFHQAEAMSSRTFIPRERITRARGEPERMVNGVGDYQKMAPIVTWIVIADRIGGGARAYRSALPRRPLVRCRAEAAVMSRSHPGPVRRPFCRGRGACRGHFVPLRMAMMSSLSRFRLRRPVGRTTTVTIVDILGRLTIQLGRQHHRADLILYEIRSDRVILHCRRRRHHRAGTLPRQGSWRRSGRFPTSLAASGRGQFRTLRLRLGQVPRRSWPMLVQRCRTVLRGRPLWASAGLVPQRSFRNSCTFDRVDAFVSHLVCVSFVTITLS